MTVLLGTIGCLVFVLSSLGYGQVLLKNQFEGLGKTEQWGLSFIVGSSIISWMVFCIGSFYYSQLIVAPLVCLGLLCFFKQLKNFNFKVKRDPLVLIGWAVFFGMLCLWYLEGLRPIQGNIFHDSIAYHLNGPKRWLLTGKIAPFLDEPRSAFPAIVDVQFGIVSLISNEMAARFLGIFQMLAAGLMCYGLTEKLGGKRFAKTILLLSLSSVPVFWKNVNIAYVDVIYATFVLTAIRVLFMAEKKGQYILAGLLAGFCMGTKYLAVPLMFFTFLLVCIFPCAFGMKNIKEHLFNMFLAFIFATIICLPYYLRNWVVLGAPVYPPNGFLYSLFPEAIGVTKSSVLKAHTIISKWGNHFGKGPLDFLLGPFRLTYFTSYFPPSGSGGFGIIPLAFLPIFFFERRKDRIVQMLLIWFLLGYTIWFFYLQDIRYIFPLLFIAFPLACVGFEKLIELYGSKLTRVVSYSVLVISIGYGLLFTTRISLPGVKNTFSHQSYLAYKEKLFPMEKAFAYLNSEDAIKKVLFLHPYVPGYYLNKPYAKVNGMVWSRPFPQFKNSRMALDEIAYFAKKGFTHLVDVSMEPNRFGVPIEYRAYNDILQNDGDFEVEENEDLRLIKSFPNVRVYQIDAQ